MLVPPVAFIQGPRKAWATCTVCAKRYQALIGISGRPVSVCGDACRLERDRITQHAARQRRCEAVKAKRRRLALIKARAAAAK